MTKTRASFLPDHIRNLIYELYAHQYFCLATDKGLQAWRYCFMYEIAQKCDIPPLILQVYEYTNLLKFH